MPQIWKQVPSGEWEPVALAGRAHGLDGDLVQEESLSDAATLEGATPLLVRHERPEVVSRWALLVPLDLQVRVNGLLVRSGLRILRDRDSVRADGKGVLYFTTERLAQVQPFPGGDEAVHCPRCKLPIEPRQDAVSCPNCQVWHHQDEASKRTCWTYSEHCSLCDQLTDLNAGYRWTPEVL